jgi:myosin-1
LLSPSTSYAGDYIWQGDDRSGCERILTDAKISKDEWQMGVTKAFIKNPETVRSLCSTSVIHISPAILLGNILSLNP